MQFEALKALISFAGNPRYTCVPLFIVASTVCPISQSLKKTASRILIPSIGINTFLSLVLLLVTCNLYTHILSEEEQIQILYSEAVRKDTCRLNLNMSESCVVTWWDAHVCAFRGRPTAGTSLIQWQLTCYILYFLFLNIAMLHTANAFLLLWREARCSRAAAAATGPIKLKEYAKPNILQHGMASWYFFWDDPLKIYWFKDSVVAFYILAVKSDQENPNWL